MLHVPCDVVLTLAQYDHRVDDGANAGVNGGEKKKLQSGAESDDAFAATKKQETVGTSAAPIDASHLQVAIGIEVYDNHGERVSRRRRGKLVASNPSSFSFRREVTAQFHLPLLDGDRPYTVLIATHQPYQEKKYVLKCYATAPIEFDLMQDKS